MPQRRQRHSEAVLGASHQVQQEYDDCKVVSCKSKQRSKSEVRDERKRGQNNVIAKTAVTGRRKEPGEREGAGRVDGSSEQQQAPINPSPMF